MRRALPFLFPLAAALLVGAAPDDPMAKPKPETQAKTKAAKAAGEKPNVLAKAKKEFDDVFAQTGLAGAVQTRQGPEGEQRRGGWEPVVTPVFPAAWPPNGKGVIYGYAHAYDTELKDGEPIGSVWAEARVTAAKARVENVRASIREIGQQGFKPISMTDPMVARWQAAQEALLAAKSEADLGDEVRKVYCRWRELNGVIAAEVAPLHPAFFDWLGCQAP